MRKLSKLAFTFAMAQKIKILYFYNQVANVMGNLFLEIWEHFRDKRRKGNIGIKVTCLEECSFRTWVFQGLPQCFHSIQQKDWKPSEHLGDWDRYLEEHSMKRLKMKQYILKNTEGENKSKIANFAHMPGNWLWNTESRLAEHRVEASWTQNEWMNEWMVYSIP